MKRTTLLLASLAVLISSAPLFAKVFLRPFDINKLPPLEHKGKIVEAARWMDKNGANVVLITEEKEGPAVYAYHYLLGKPKPKLEWKMKDTVAGFVNKSFSITDLDNNNVAEATFVYKKSNQLKLVMLEGKKIYSMAGDSKSDKALNSKPEFKQHATAVWGKISEQKP